MVESYKTVHLSKNSCYTLVRSGLISVQKANPAVRLYEKLGFSTVRKETDEQLMRKELYGSRSDSLKVLL